MEGEERVSGDQMSPNTQVFQYAIKLLLVKSINQTVDPSLSEAPTPSLLSICPLAMLDDTSILRCHLYTNALHLACQFSAIVFLSSAQWLTSHHPEFDIVPFSELTWVNF